MGLFSFNRAELALAGGEILDGCGAGQSRVGAADSTPIHRRRQISNCRLMPLISSITLCV